MRWRCGRTLIRACDDDGDVTVLNFRLRGHKVKAPWQQMKISRPRVTVAWKLRALARFIDTSMRGCTWVFWRSPSPLRLQAVLRCWTHVENSTGSSATRTPHVTARKRELQFVGWRNGRCSCSPCLQIENGGRRPERKPYRWTHWTTFNSPRSLFRTSKPRSISTRVAGLDCAQF